MPQASSLPVSPADSVLIRAWTHNRPENTAAAYRRDATAFLAHAGKPLAEATLADLQAWDESMAGHAPASRARRLNAVRSLIKFAADMGAITADPARGLRIPKVSSDLAARIIAEPDVLRMIEVESDPRRRALLNLLYRCGLRASEAAGLRWRDMTARGKAGGEARILGKGGKARTVAIPLPLWRDLVALTPNAKPDAPAVPARDGSLLDRQAVFRAVKRAARRAGLSSRISPHGFRHSHASHALDRGAPPQVVMATLGHASLATTTRYAHARVGDSSTGYLSE